MKNVSRTAKKTIFAGILFAVSFTAFYIVHVSTTDNQEKLAMLREEIGSVAGQEEMIRSMKNLVKDTQSERNELEAQLLSRTDPAPFLGLLEDIATDAHVIADVTSLSEEPLPVVDEKGGVLYGGVGGPVVRAVVEVEGGFAQIYHLITLVELMPYGVVLERVGVQREKGAVAWSGTLTMDIYTR